MSFIQAINLVKNYGDGEARVSAVTNISFEINQGEFTAVMGPSGSGKSTLLSIMGALNTPDNGVYKVDDIDIYTLNSDKQADFRREYLGFVFQNFNLLPFLTIIENVMLPLTTKRISLKEKKEMAREALNRVGLSGKENRLPGEASGGEQERAAIARAIVNNPPVLLADEPTGNLDATTGHKVMEFLQDLSSKGMTIVMVTHNKEYVLYASRVLQIMDGRLTIDNGKIIKAA